MAKRTFEYEFDDAVCCYGRQQQRDIFIKLIVETASSLKDFQIKPKNC